MYYLASKWDANGPMLVMREGEARESNLHSISGITLSTSVSLETPILPWKTERPVIWGRTTRPSVNLSTSGGAPLVFLAVTF